MVQPVPVEVDQLQTIFKYSEVSVILQSICKSPAVKRNNKGEISVGCIYLLYQRGYVRT